jgi:hypothetical protein
MMFLDCPAYLDDKGAARCWHRGGPMIASFHLVEYRRRSFSPPKRLAGQAEGLLFWRPLNVGGDFAWFREHTSRRALYPRLRPDLHR